MVTDQLSDSSSNSSVIEPHEVTRPPQLPAKQSPKLSPPKLPPPKLPQRKPPAKERAVEATREARTAAPTKREVPQPRPAIVSTSEAPAIVPMSEPPAGVLTGMLLATREWLVTQGMWWGASAVTHAVVLAGGLLIFGSVVVREKIDSVAPAFESAGGVDTLVDVPPDLESDLSSQQIENSPLGDLAMINAWEGGNASGTGTPSVNGLSSGPSSSDARQPRGRSRSDTTRGNFPICGFTVDKLPSELKIPGSPGGTRTVGNAPPRRRSIARINGCFAADNTDGAVDHLLSGIKREMAEGDLLVVWLIDASISLVADRQKVADRVDPFYRELERRGKGVYRLQNAVVAFGDTTVEVVKPTSYSSAITAAIRDLPVDGSGKENVMTAVRQCMDEYGRTWKGGMMIIVWTDESGDDILQLEETIEGCRKRRAVVNVVGPTAVLGSERGRHHYVDRATGQAFLLPIKRGPDTCLPERLFLPYWWDSPLAPWIQDGVVAAHGVPWYGGPHREGILSGTGPYALTRLALETGGQFIMLDRQEDKSAFDMTTMKRYLTDYVSAEEYLKGVNASPLRKSISEAVQATYSSANLWPPATAFILHRDTHYPFRIYSGGYRRPAHFRELLKAELPKQLAHAKAAAEVVERALAVIPPGGMESEYAGERSARWRAWYDLTRGRLLAMSIRTLEYQLACEKVWSPGYLLPDTNSLKFEPSTTYLSGEACEARAQEAIRLLRRCKEQNANTPWELLADWELMHPFGIEIHQVANVPPLRPSPPAPIRPPAPKIEFPKL